MFCQKCGTQNPENGKFCRSCGIDLTPVSDALSGKSSSQNRGDEMIEPIQPMQLSGEQGRPVTWERALGKLFLGLAFLVASIIMAFSRGGTGWWFWLLIPAFVMLARGIAQYIQLKKEEQKANSISAPETNKAFSASPVNTSLPPSQNDYISQVQSGYKTGELVHLSVTEETTRHLEINQEGETMTLPKTKQ
ncbi:MAG TPA: zinc ribbon domain-containing protein [Pyrinomonadaceae bacterium]|nr:zinc ribbon domain-containing protein [Pyrinomonadaceae bacterium]